MPHNCFNCANSIQVKGANYLLCSWHGGAEIPLTHADIDCGCEGWKNKKRERKYGK